MMVSQRAGKARHVGDVTLDNVALFLDVSNQRGASAYVVDNRSSAARDQSTTYEGPDHSEPSRNQHFLSHVALDRAEVATEA